MMPIAEHVDALKNKHAQLEQKIEVEENRPSPDPAVIHSLKREKLRIRDEIESHHPAH